MKNHDFKDSLLVKLLLELFYYKTIEECKLYIREIKNVMREIKIDYGINNPGDSQNFVIELLDKLISEIKNEISSDNISIFDGNIPKKQKYFNFQKEFNNKNNLIEKLFQF